MIELESSILIKEEAICKNLKKLTNQVYKLLPEREEGANWQLPLDTIIEEFAGMGLLFIDHHDILFPLLCKLKGLKTLNGEDDFSLFRRTIFDCLNLINALMNKCQRV